MVMCYRNTNIFSKITWQQIKCRKYIYKKIYIIHLLQENSKALSLPQDKSWQNWIMDSYCQDFFCYDVTWLFKKIYASVAKHISNS